MKKILSMALAAAIVFGFFAMATPAHAGKGGKGKPPPPSPPECPCPDVIEGSGYVCVLDDCAELLPGAFECLYICYFI